MAIRPIALVTVFFALALPAGPAEAASSSCKIEGLAEIPVTMRRSQPMIPAKINGTDKPAWTVQTSRRPIKCRSWSAHGVLWAEPRPKPLSCGARMYIVTRASMKVYE